MLRLSDRLSSGPHAPRSSRHTPRALAALVAAACLGAVALAAPAASAVVAPGAARTAAAATPVADPTTYVDPFMATEHDYGQDIPGAFAPSGIVKANPVTYPTRSHSGYDYAQSQITGFVHTDMDGAGGNGAGGDFLVVPTTVDYTHRPSAASYAKPFTHADEEAEPGYYRVGLGATTGTDDAVTTAAGTIDAEVAALARTGVDRYTFPTAGAASLVVDLNTNFDRRVTSSVTVATLADGRASLSGEIVGTHGGTYRLYYYAETSRPVARVQTWDGTGALTGATRQRGWDDGVVLGFDLPVPGAQVSLAVTFSAISVAQAQRDQRAELTAAGAADGSSARPLDDTTLDAVRAASHQTWADLLGRVRVTASDVSDPATADGPGGELRGLFYTSLYRMLGAPVDVTSTDGTYRGGDGVVYPADGRAHYESWSTWDDFRKYGVMSVLYPERYRDMVQSMVDMFAQMTHAGVTSPSQLGHAVPGVRWERSAIVIADALSKGYALDGLDEAYPALARYSGSAYSSTGIPKAGDRTYLPNASGVDDTVGTSYDDWAMAQIASALGKTSDAAGYLARAANYANLIKPGAWTAADGAQVGVLTPRDGSGWIASDLEKFQLNDPYQGSLWQYHWYGAHDMAGLMAAMGGPGATDGGRAATAAALSHFFGEESPDDCTRMLHSNANEVDIQTPYLFNYLGQPAKTQKWVREIYTAPTCNRYVATTENLPGIANGGEFLTPAKQRVYKLAPDGLLPTMDDDLGTMSAMFVGAAVGLFPLAEGTDQLQIGTPFFDRVDVTHDDGTVFSIRADGVSPSSYYIQSATLQTGAAPARAQRETWVTYGDLVGDGTLGLTMGPSPSTWGVDGAAGYSMSDPSTHASTTGPQPAPAAGEGTAATWRDRLTRDLAQAEPVVRGRYTASSYAVLENARDLATAALADPTTSRERLRTLDARLTGAADALTLDEGGLRRLEAESPASSGAPSGVAAPKGEANASSGDLGGIKDGAWITYQQMTWGDGSPTGLQVRYANPAGSGSDDATVEIHAGSTNGPLVGVLDLPSTGTAWGDYRVASVPLPVVSALTTSSSVTFVFHGSGSSVANVDWLQLTTTPVATREPLTAGNAAEDGAGIEGAALNLDKPGLIQNITDGAWVRYAAAPAADPRPAASLAGADRVSVRYDKPTSRTPKDSSLEIRTGSATGPLVGTVPLTYTGSGWGTYATTEVALDRPELLTGDQDVYVVFRATGADANQPYVANVLSLRFSSAPDASALRFAQQAAQAALADQTHQLPASVATLRSALDDAAWVLAATGGDSDVPAGGSLDQADVDTAVLRLRLATEQIGLVAWTPPTGPPVVDPPVVTPPVVTPPATAAARVSVTVTKPRYRKQAKVRVTVSALRTGSAAASVPPSGSVVVSQGTRRLGTATLSRSGAATTAVVRLPKGLKVGKHRLAVTYLPTASAHASSASAQVVLHVRKGLPNVTVTGARGLRAGQRATLTVRVKKLGGYKPRHGKVKVRVAGHVVGKAKVVKRHGVWTAVVRTASLTRTGKLKVSFTGTKKLAPRTVTPHLKVRR